jgi:hypothetical protein
MKQPLKTEFIKKKTIEFPYDLEIPLVYWVQSFVVVTVFKKRSHYAAWAGFELLRQPSFGVSVLGIWWMVRKYWRWIVVTVAQ